MPDAVLKAPKRSHKGMEHEGVFLGSKPIRNRLWEMALRLGTAEKTPNLVPGKYSFKVVSFFGP
jgi:hypothetical protein